MVNVNVKNDMAINKDGCVFLEIFETSLKTLTFLSNTKNVNNLFLSKRENSQHRRDVRATKA